MKRMVLIPVIAAAAVLLVVTGAIAGIIIADSDDGNATTAAENTGSNGGSGKGSLGLTVSFSSQNGLRVSAVEAGGPAEAAGIQVGDVIRSVDGQIVRTPEQLRTAAEAKAPGERVTITYERADQELRAQVELGEAPASAAANPTPASTTTPGQPGAPAPGQARGGRLGITVQQITPQLQQRMNLQRDSGVVVMDVAQNGPGASAGLQRGDVILTVGATRVGTVLELQRAILAAPTLQAVEIGIQRGANQTTVSAVLPSQANLEGLGDLLPEELRQRVQELIEKGAVSAEQLQQYLRLYQNRGQGVQVGIVESIDPGSAGGTFTITMSPYLGGSDATVELNEKTSILRGVKRIQAGEIEEGELVLVLSNDNGETAFQVMAFGKLG
jgi:membrane-associated protease RseP (regulator of RpoE activity)